MINMSYTETISSLVESLFENSKKASSKYLFKKNKKTNDIYHSIDAIIKSENNIAVTQNSRDFFHSVNEINDYEFKELMLHLKNERDIDLKAIKSATQAYANENSEDNYINLQKSTISERKILFRKLNSFGESTIHLVKLRERIIKDASTNQDYRKIDSDLKTLFIDWFNRGFLVLKPIDWNTPASILEKIIKYESVHQINSWKELRDRIDSADRRCYAFFHPAMGNEPLIFVEVALTRDIPNNINQILNTERSPDRINTLKKAIFYSISNCQRGLDGISFGNYLIKDVVKFIQSELPTIKEFFTLSPVPDFMEWMKSRNNDLYNNINNHPNVETLTNNQNLFNDLIREYLLISDRSDNRPNDSVTRFHIGNGASMHQINFLADTSKNAIKYGCSFMVNYKYDMNNIKENQKRYATDNKVPHKKSI